MTAMTPAARAVAGALSVVLLSAVGYLGALAAMGEFAERRHLDVTLGDLGQGIVEGSDVKIRGALVGEVAEINLDDDLRAVATLELEPAYAVPERATYAVTGKTLLGEKQVEIVFDGPWDEGPFLADGAHVDDPDRVVEFQDVLAELADLFEHVDPDDLAVLVADGLGAFDGQADLIARSVDEGARGVDTFARSLDDQMAGLHDLSLVAERLGREGPAFNRMAEELIAGLPTLSDNQADTRELMAELERLAPTLNATLTADRESIDRILIEGDSVTRMMFAYRPEVGELVTGLSDYTQKFGDGFESPGHRGDAARFIAILEGVDPLCEIPVLSEGMDCEGEGHAAGAGDPAEGGGPTGPQVDIPIPDGVLEPQRPSGGPGDLDHLLERLLEGGRR